MVPSSLATNTATPFFVFATTGFRSSSPLAVTSSASHFAGPDTQAWRFTSVPYPKTISPPKYAATARMSQATVEMATAIVR